MPPLRRQDMPAELNQTTEAIVDAAVEVHRHLHAGHRERAYEEALHLELQLRGVEAQRQVRYSLSYKGASLAAEMVADLVVAGTVIVEIKAVEDFHPVHEAQLLSYLAASGLPVGLLINFHAPTLRGQIRRFVRSQADPRFRASAADGGHEAGGKDPDLRSL